MTWPVIPGNESLLLYHILLMIWGAGILYRVWKNGRFYSRVKKEISLFEKEPDARILEEAKTLWKEYPELEKARIKICALVDSPLLFGIRHPVILLPEEGTISAEDIRYILGHEALHMRAHDTLRKVMIDMVCIIGWWNPLFGRLRRELFRVIEIDNDLKITERMAVRERAEYVACLCKTARNSVSQKHFGAISFSSEGGKELKNRFDFIMERIKGTQRIQWAACLAVIVGVFASWSVVFEPAFPVPEDVIEMTKDNTYVVEEGGKYRVYLNGEYTFTTDTLEYFPKDVTVYKEEK